VKITAVKAWWLHVPIEAQHQHTSDFGKHSSFDTALVRVETDAGLVGHGEAKAAVGGTGVYGALVQTIVRDLGPAVVGLDPRDPALAWETLYNGSRAHYALAAGHSFPNLGRRGLTISGLSGIDIALWDILGQSLGAPIWRLLGGATHAWLPAYASGGWADAAGIGAQLKGYTEKGFRAVKMRIGAQDGTPQASAERVIAARKALGPGIGLMTDAHGTFHSRDAKRFARLVEPCDLAWFEEPVSADDLEGLAEVRAATDISIAAGESMFTRFEFRDAIAARAVDILQPDPAICGGITETARIAALAATHQLRLAPHLWGGAVMFAAGLHVSIASPAAYILEYSLGRNPMLHELAPETFPVVDGGIAAPERPGLGVTPRQAFIERYAVKL